MAWHTFSARGQVVNIVGFAGCTGLYYILFFAFYLQPFKNVKTPLSVLNLASCVCGSLSAPAVQEKVRKHLTFQK